MDETGEILSKIKQMMENPGEAEADFVVHGSPEHARFIGLVEVVTDEDKAEAEAAGFVTYEDPRDGRSWRTFDEDAPLRWFPNLEPKKAIQRVIISKLNEFHDGNPEPSS